MRHGCREVTALISRSLDEPLPPLGRLRVRVHLLWCSACRNFARQSRLLRRACRQLARRLAAEP